MFRNEIVVITLKKGTYQIGMGDCPERLVESTLLCNYQVSLPDCAIAILKIQVFQDESQ